jgi:hypothetical protein
MLNTFINIGNYKRIIFLTREKMAWEQNVSLGMDNLGKRWAWKNDGAQGNDIPERKYKD